MQDKHGKKNIKIFFFYICWKKLSADECFVTASCGEEGVSGGGTVSSNTLDISSCMLCLSSKFRHVLNSVSNMRLGHPEEMMITHRRAVVAH